MRLTLNMFGHEFGNRPATPFGLHSGQMRSDTRTTSKVAHNGAWYSQDGVRIGWGDLSIDDVRRIQANLTDGDYFFVLGESSFWAFVRNHGPIGSMCETAPTIDNPGVDYVRENFMYLITPDHVYYKARHESQEAYEHGGILIRPLTVEGLVAK